MNEIQRYWEAVDDVEVIRLPEGESGLTPKQALTQKRLEAIAEWFAIPESKRDPRDIAGLARALGVSPAIVRKWQKDPRMIRRVQQKTIEFLTYLVPNLAWKQYEKAMETGDTKAADFVRGMAMPSSPGRGVNVNTTVNVGREEVSDDLALQELRAYVQRARVSGDATIVTPEQGDVEANPGHQEE